MNSKQRRRVWRLYEDRVVSLEFQYRVLAKRKPARDLYVHVQHYYQQLKLTVAALRKDKYAFDPFQTYGVLSDSSIQHRQSQSRFPFYQAPIFDLTGAVATVPNPSNICREQIPRQVLDDAIDALKYYLFDSGMPLVRGSTFVARSTNLTSKEDHDRPKSS